MDFFFSVQELLDVECVLGIVVGRELIVGMLGQIVLVREERPHSSKLQDAFAAVQHRQLVPAHKLMTKFLVVGAVAGAVAASIRIVEAINRLLAKCLGQFFQRGRFIAAQKDLRIHVANDGISIVFVDSLELAAGLQDQTGRNLTAADGRHQLFELRNLPDVGALVDEATHMDRQLAAILVICLIAEQVEKLGVNHGNQKVEGECEIIWATRQKPDFMRVYAA